ncbi:MAG: Mrp/NBP35 family ATP-binding protein [Eubacteriales bacterium]|nr:Mrp/NBP35 family ATP-binding protein [Eubacteriales bacterium]
MAEKSCSGASSCSKESCEGCPSKQQPESFLVDANMYSEVKKVIGIVSGKGGVGKSMVTASLANELAAKGYRVGIMDADITGPSIPKMYGLKGPAMADDEGIYPMITENGIKVISINLLMPDEEAPVIWRGPVIAGVVKQFWSDVIWGELDYLLVDMPPGTGDVPLTVFQSLPVDGVVIVSSPQDLVRMIVKKAYNMAKTMNIPVYGIVENYSYLKCPDCGKEISVFGESHIEEIAANLETEVLGKMPIDSEYAKLADGSFAGARNPYIEKAVQAVR